MQKLFEKSSLQWKIFTWHFRETFTWKIHYVVQQLTTRVLSCLIFTKITQEREEVSKVCTYSRSNKLFSSCAHAKRHVETDRIINRHIDVSTTSKGIFTCVESNVQRTMTYKFFYVCLCVWKLIVLLLLYVFRS